MPNWCINNLYLTQENPALLKAFADLEDATEGTQIPGIGMERYFFDVTVEDGNIRFDTRWCPYVDDMQKIALFFKTDFECEYEERGDEIFGKMIYKDGIFTNYCLEQDEIELIYERDNGKDDEEDFKDDYTTILDGEEYEHYLDAIEVLIERKIKKATNAPTDQTSKENGETVISNP